MKFSISFILAIFYLLNTNAQSLELFNEHHLIDIEGESISTSMIDFNQDGKKDLIIFPKNENVIYWLENTGFDNVVGLDSITTVRINTDRISFKDLDLDGDLDLLYTSISSSGNSEFIEIYYRKNHQGLFLKSQLLSEINYDRKSSFFVDIDKDDLVDIVSLFSSKEERFQGQFPNSEFKIIKNRGDFNFDEEQTLVVLPNDIIYPHTIKFLDLDQDNYEDIIYQSAFTESDTTYEKGIYYLKNLSGSGYDKTIGLLPENFNSINYLSSMIFEDSGNNKDLFLGTCDWKSNVGRLYHFQNNGTYPIEEFESLTSLSNLCYYPKKFVDINSDGESEIIYQSLHFEGHDNGNLYYLDNSSVQKRLFWLGSKSLKSIIDYDNDGVMDLFVSHSTGTRARGIKNSYYIYINAINQTVNNELEEKNRSIGLKQNYPNPFNPTTNFVFEVDKSQEIHFKIFDLTGRVVAEISPKIYSSGRHEVTFNASDLSSGVYFYRMIGEGFTETNKFTLIK